MEYKPGDKIDLSKLGNKREKSVDNLTPLLEMTSVQTNEWVLREFGLKDLVNKDGSISIHSFTEEYNGPYSTKDIREDEDKVTEIEKIFAGAKKEENLITQKKIIEEWHKDKLKQKSSKAEMLITILLHRILKDRFIVTRTAPIDDYTEGVDYIIVNPDTGETICAFDGVAENDSKENQFSIKNSEKKKQKIEKITKDGGANIKYGIQVVDNKLVRKNISNMPLFYLSLSDKDFDSLMALTVNKIDTPIKQEENIIFSKFIQSLEEQRLNLLKLNLRKNAPLYQKLLEFEKTINMLKNINSKSNIKNIDGNIDTNQGKLNSAA